ncbi:MAG: hypothetical protein M1837_005807 [Sclerophora amabilis]|nr:MAG: hypothetical protein M1837_005807 [Sclerophora amabilis]
MTSHKKSSRHSSSPRTSEEADSYRGSPESKLTVFSPDEARVFRSPGGGVRVIEKGPPAFVLDPDHYQLPDYLKSPNLAAMAPTNQLASGQCLSDPFATKTKADLTGTRTTDQKLSPTARSFTPLNALEDAATTLHHSRPASAKAAAPTSSGIGFLNATSVPDIDIGREHPRSIQKTSSLVQPVGKTDRSSWSIDPKGNLGCPGTPQSLGTILGEEPKTFRAVMIENVALDKTMIEQINNRHFATVKGPILLDLVLGGVIYLGFAEGPDFESALRKVRTMCPEWRVRRISPASFDQKCIPISSSASQVLVKACFPGPIEKSTRDSLEQLLPDILGNYGDLLAYQNINVHELSKVTGIATYREATAAEHAGCALNGFKIQGCVMAVVTSQPNTEAHSPHGPGDNSMSSSSDSSLGRQLSDSGTSKGSNLDRSSFPSSNGLQDDQFRCFSTRIPCPQSSPSGYVHASENGIPRDWSSGYDYPSPISSHFSDKQSFSFRPFDGGKPNADYKTWQVSGPWDVHGTIGQERAQPRNARHVNMRSSPRRGHGRTSGRQEHDSGPNSHNIVDVGRIRRGLDVRTTIMLRNIPNKIDQAMLKSIVDETSAGRYDFMYLRIDFANNCNVGYAFINFEDPYFIIDFVQATAGFRWNRFNSDKVAEVSYATIQGKDCLVQKFRNSSVMLEHPSFRPKIFYTGPGPMAGTEDVFPGPDNPSKMRRSVENAEHVGLFAPRAGQNSREEQRRRRSQYDRGTRLAEMEESYDHDLRHEESVYQQRSFRPGSYDHRQFSHHSGRLGSSF